MKSTHLLILLADITTALMCAVGLVVLEGVPLLVWMLLNGNSLDGRLMPRRKR